MQCDCCWQSNIELTSIFATPDALPPQRVLQVVQSIGLFAFKSPPPVFLALTGQLLCVLVAARLSRNTIIQSRVSDVCLGRSAPLAQHHHSAG